MSVVAPVFNESASMDEFVHRLSQTCRTLEDRYSFEFVLVDDGSTDRSLERARELLSASRVSALWSCDGTSDRRLHSKPG